MNLSDEEKGNRVKSETTKQTPAETLRGLRGQLKELRESLAGATIDKEGSGMPAELREEMLLHLDRAAHLTHVFWRYARIE